MTSRELIEQSKYFHVNENWGNLDKIDPKLIKIMLDLRAFVGYPIIVNCAYVPGTFINGIWKVPGHGNNSYHGKHDIGRACDFSIRQISFVMAINLVQEWLQRTIELDGEQYLLDSYCGIGIYPYWNTPGFHLDTRGTKARWAFDKKGNQISFEKGIEIAQSKR